MIDCVYRTLEPTADAASIIYQHEVLSERLQGLEKDHAWTIAQICEQLVQCEAQFHVESTPCKPTGGMICLTLSKESTPDEFAI